MWRKPPTELVSEVQDHNDIRIMDASEDRIVLTTSNSPVIGRCLNNDIRPAKYF